VGWVPLIALCAFQATAAEPMVRWILSDVAVSCRSLAAAPLLILAMPVCLPRLSEIARNFRSSGILSDDDFAAFDHAWSTTLRWCSFTSSDIVIVVVAYALAASIILRVPEAEFPPWYMTGLAGGSARHSLAAWWHIGISLPLLFVLVLGWIWRVILWWRFLYLVSRLELRLVPSHPDHTAGLRFVGYSVQSFSLVALAFGFIVAGTAANRILYRNGDIGSLEPSVVMLVAFVLILFVGPLIVFTPHLLRAWRRGVLEYGTIAARLGRTFEGKWLSRDQAIDSSSLDVQDFSATTDLYQVASNVYEVRLFPVGLMSLGMLVAMTMCPFAAIALLFVPIDVVINEFIALLT
jgi:hypothetical protein